MFKNLLKVFCLFGLHDYKITTTKKLVNLIIKYYQCKNCKYKTRGTYSRFEEQNNGRSGENEYDDRRGSNCC